MLKAHQDIIISNLSVLVAETDLQSLVSELLRKNVFNERMINRILNPSHNAKRQKTDLYVEILKRGPQAFEKLQEALISTNQHYLAGILKDMDSRNSFQIHRSSSLNSVNSSFDESEGDGICSSLRRKNSAPVTGNKTPPKTYPTSSAHSSTSFQGSSNNEKIFKTFDMMDFQKQNVNNLKQKVFNLPSYTIEILDENSREINIRTPDDTVRYTSQTNLPVNVKLSTHWQSETPDKPFLYKMDSYPRGYALLVNNIEFCNEEDYPKRLGSENDEIRFSRLLTQLHFVVELHRNKTCREMREIVNNFAKKPELDEVDCVWITFMSHGEEGNSCEDSQIIGIDGIGVRTGDIISPFYNDNCRALIYKPKLFFFQACRGTLTDPGVLLGKLNIELSNRITTDSKKVQPISSEVKVRTHSDIFIAYPTPAGITANRDRITGGWFTQAVVDIFSEHAWNTHLEDLLKLVDRKIKNMNNLITSNFQAITTNTIGWNKHLFFNPGMYRDKISRATIFIGSTNETEDPEKGMDVVDASSTNSDKSPNGINYARLKQKKGGGEEEEEDSDDQSGSFGCFHFSGCKTS